MRHKRHDQIGAMDDPDLPKYSISVAADISGVPQQQLRRMEDNGLLAPQRSQGNTRRYSDNDLRQIAAIFELADDGINTAGVRLVLELRAEVAALRAEVELLRQQLTALRDASMARDQRSNRQGGRSGTRHASARAADGRHVSAT